MTDFICSPVKTDEAIRVLSMDGLFTFAVVVGGEEFHQQIPIKDYDTRDKIEKRMAEIGAQVAEEVTRNKPPSVPDEVMALLSE